LGVGNSCKEKKLGVPERVCETQGCGERLNFLSGSPHGVEKYLGREDKRKKG